MKRLNNHKISYKLKVTLPSKYFVHDTFLSWVAQKAARTRLD
jgi:hypothetical protein